MVGISTISHINKPKIVQFRGYVETNNSAYTGIQFDIDKLTPGQICIVTKELIYPTHTDYFLYGYEGTFDSRYFEEMEE